MSTALKNLNNALHCTCNTALPPPEILKGNICPQNTKMRNFNPSPPKKLSASPSGYDILSNDILPPVLASRSFVVFASQSHSVRRYDFTRLDIAMASNTIGKLVDGNRNLAVEMLSVSDVTEEQFRS